MNKPGKKIVSSLSIVCIAVCGLEVFLKAIEF